MTRRSRRKGVGQQLRYLRWNLAPIDTLIVAGTSLSQLGQVLYCKLLVISEVFRQQQWMYSSKRIR